MPCITSDPSSALSQKLRSMEGKMATHHAANTAAERLRKVHILIADAVLWKEFQDEVKKSGVVTSAGVEMVLNNFIAHMMENIDTCQETIQHSKKSRWNISKLTLKKQQPDGQFQKSIESLIKKRPSYPLEAAKTRENGEIISAPTVPPFGTVTWSMTSGSLGKKGSIQRTKPQPSSLLGSPPPHNDDARITVFALRHNRESDRDTRRKSMSEILHHACTLTERNTPLQQLRGHDSPSMDGFVELEKSYSLLYQSDLNESEKYHGSRFGINVPRFWKKDDT